ncbi:MAG: hypothetical protein GXO56_04725 [Chloroflexi bacterium]|nr:hypothetical protein [Chloroflexota bacterium]
MRTIRASEIGTYLYCHRAWGYARQGHRSTNQEAMQAGTEYHRRHGQAVFFAGVLRFIGWALLLLALMVLAAWWAWSLTGG